VLQADIGIVVNVSPRRTAMHASNRTRRILATLCIALAAAALTGATVWTTVQLAPVMSPVARTESPAPMVGTLIGEFESGVPVYRLPAIIVTASRSVELARMAREEQMARM
jgi:hypothetical protein